MVDERRVFTKIAHPVFMILFYLFLYIPIFLLVLFSFNDSAFAVRWKGFSLRWYQEIFATPEILQAAQTSLIVACAATGLSLLLGLGLVFASKWWRAMWPFSLFRANILFPEIILAAGLLSMFLLFNIPLGYGSLIAGHTVIGLGFVVPIVKARFNELDPILTEASADLGATSMQTFRKIIIPLLLPSIIASALLVFTISLDDFLIAFFCSGTQIQTLSVYVYSLVRTGVNPIVNAISACLLLVSSAMIVVLCGLKVIDQVIGNE